MVLYAIMVIYLYNFQIFSYIFGSNHFDQHEGKLCFTMMHSTDFQWQIMVCQSLFFILFPDSFKSIFRASLRALGQQFDKKVLRYHILGQLGVTMLMAIIIASFTDLNIGAFTIAKVIFEVVMAVIYYLTQSEIEWSEKALLARSRME